MNDSSALFETLSSQYIMSSNYIMSSQYGKHWPLLFIYEAIEDKCSKTVEELEGAHQWLYIVSPVVAEITYRNRNREEVAIPCKMIHEGATASETGSRLLAVVPCICPNQNRLEKVSVVIRKPLCCTAPGDFSVSRLELNLPPVLTRDMTENSTETVDRFLAVLARNLLALNPALRDWLYGDAGLSTLGVTVTYRLTTKLVTKLKEQFCARHGNELTEEHRNSIFRRIEEQGALDIFS